MEFLGVLIDTVKMTLQVTEERLVELDQLLADWINYDLVCKKQMQSLIGKLNFVATCVRSSRIFFSRLLNFLRQMPGGGQVQLDLETKKDIKWWKECVFYK